MREAKRARRRRDLQRMKAKAVRVYTKYVNESRWIRTKQGLGEPVESWDPRRHEKLANHIKCCSCAGCGNPRHYPGWGEPKTLQELRFEAVDIYEE